MAFLVGLSGTLKGERLELKKDRTTLGRAPSNDVVVKDDAASSQHCYISCCANRFVIHDMNSTNGTRVDNQPITETELQHQQTIQIGASEFLFENERPEDVPTVAAVTPDAPEAPASIAPVPLSKSQSFSSVSPFGARRQENKLAWQIAIAFVTFLAVLGVTFFVWKVLTGIP